MVTSVCIVVSSQTLVAWGEVVATLERKHKDKQTKVVVYNEDVKECLSELSIIMPIYSVFVAQPHECTRAFVRNVHVITRSMDASHPFSDTIWGIIAASSEDDALLIARESAPLTIRKVFSGTVEGSEIDMFQSGIAYNELVYGHLLKKDEGARSAETHSYTGDQTIPFASDLNTQQPDMIITSGHARQRVWYTMGMKSEEVVGIALWLFHLPTPIPLPPNPHHIYIYIYHICCIHT